MTTKVTSEAEREYLLSNLEEMSKVMMHSIEVDMQWLNNWESQQESAERRAWGSREVVWDTEAMELVYAAVGLRRELSDIMRRLRLIQETARVNHIMDHVRISYDG